jgi:peptidoglycan hydrolase-like protein with peptidoglycan-binding domain
MRFFTGLRLFLAALALLAGVLPAAAQLNPFGPNFQPLPPLGPSCAPGYHLQGSTCVPNQIVIECAPGYHPQGTNCVPNQVVIDCAPGYHLQGNDCVPNQMAIDCAPGYHPEGDACVADAPAMQCPAGYHPAGQGCVPDQGGGGNGGSGGSSGSGSAGGSGSSAAGSSGGGQHQPDPQILHTQQCLSFLGFNPGPIDGLSGRATLAAFVAFQNANGLGERPPSLADQPSLDALDQLCANPPAPPAANPPPPAAANPAPPAGEEPAPLVPDEAAAQPEPEPEPEPGPAAVPVPGTEACVDAELVPALMAAYPGRQTPVECQPHCLPPPADQTAEDLDGLARRHGITWCNACIALQSYVRPDVIRQIEAASGGQVTLCGGPAICFIPPPMVLTRVDTVFAAYPVGIGNDNDKKIAVVIGNENYRNDLMPNENGINDGDAVDLLLTEHLGYRRGNIIDLRDATLADLERVFGSKEKPAGELAERVGPDGEDVDVVIYLASHGITGNGPDDAYILPVDGLPENPAGTAYALDLLYDNLAALHARTIMLFVEGRFGPEITDAVEPANVPSLDVGIFPKAPVPGLAVIRATDGNQSNLQTPEYGLGLFTRWLIEGLAGGADTAPVGNGDGRVDTVELYVYTANKVGEEASVSLGLTQTPLKSDIENLLVGRLEH